MNKLVGTREITQRFITEQEKAPFLGDCVIFLRTVRALKIKNLLLVQRTFNKLVNKEDYAPREKEKLVKWIYGQIV